MSSAAADAVFTELSPDAKQAMPGFNRRVFTDTDINKGSAIQCDFTIGIVTLAPGAYHHSDHAMVAYFTKDDPPETIVTRSPASAGYCRLRSFDPSTRPIFAAFPMKTQVSSASAARARPTSCPARSRASTKSGTSRGNA